MLKASLDNHGFANLNVLSPLPWLAWLSSINKGLRVSSPICFYLVSLWLPFIFLNRTVKHQSWWHKTGYKNSETLLFVFSVVEFRTEELMKKAVEKVNKHILNGRPLKVKEVEHILLWCSGTLPLGTPS